MTYALVNGAVGAGLILSGAFGLGMVITVAAFPLLAALMSSRVMPSVQQNVMLKDRLARTLAIFAALGIICLGHGCSFAHSCYGGSEVQIGLDRLQALVGTAVIRLAARRAGDGKPPSSDPAASIGSPPPTSHKAREMALARILRAGGCTCQTERILPGSLLSSRPCWSRH
jgi:hypothetical protein